MKQELVEINLHGNIFEGIKSQYKLAVKNVGEAIHAVNTLTRNKLFTKFLENDKKNIKYEILINKNPCLFSATPDINNPETLLNSELVMNFHNLKTIDIVPVIEGAGQDVGLIIAGIVLVAIGILSLNFEVSILGVHVASLAAGVMVLGGLALIAAGVINLLSTPPKLDDFKSASRKGSYLFDGPENVAGEGGPVPLIYGQLLVGSQTVEVTINNTYQLADALLSQGA